MIINSLRTDRWYDVSACDAADDSSGMDPYYSHVCADESGIGRVPIPVAILQEGAVGAEAREWLRRWIARQDAATLQSTAGNWFKNDRQKG